MTTISVLVQSAGPLESDDGLFSKSDPYVYLQLEDCDSQQTSTVNNDNTPEWNETLTFEGVDQPASKTLSLKIYDDDTWSRDDKIGEVKFPLAELKCTPDPQEFEKVCDEGMLTDGKIKFTITTDGTWGNPTDGTGGLTVMIGTCTGLDDADFGGTTDPYAYLQIDGCDALSTSVKEGTINPEWNEELTFESIEDPLTKVLKITIYDQDTWSRDDKIGYCEVPLCELPCAETPFEKTVDWCMAGLVKQATLTFTVTPKGWGGWPASS